MGGGQIRFNPVIPQGKFVTVEGYGAILAGGAGAPTASAAGYAPGCQYIDYAGGAAYTNTGTLASATWALNTHA